MVHDPETDPDAPQLELERAAWEALDAWRACVARDVVERATLRVLAQISKRPPAELEGEREALLEPYRAGIDHDVEILTRAIEAARTEGISAVHRGLHRLTTTDHDLLDQAIEYAVTGPVDGRSRKR